MKRTIYTLLALFTVLVNANAMSYEQAREEALFLTDKMAYELDLNEEQYEAAYEINLDYLMELNTAEDVYAEVWYQRNSDLRCILLDWQYTAFCAATYFYRPVFWSSGIWHFGIYTYYPNRTHFYFSHPTVYVSYTGGHSWRHNGGRSWYVNRTHHYVGHSTHIGMRAHANHDVRTSATIGHRSGTYRSTASTSQRNSYNHNEGTYRRNANGTYSRNEGSYRNGSGTYHTNSGTTYRSNSGSTYRSSGNSAYRGSNASAQHSNTMGNRYSSRYDDDTYRRGSSQGQRSSTRITVDRNNNRTQGSQNSGTGLYDNSHPAAGSYTPSGSTTTTNRPSTEGQTGNRTHSEGNSGQRTHTESVNSGTSSHTSSMGSTFRSGNRNINRESVGTYHTNSGRTYRSNTGSTSNAGSSFRSSGSTTTHSGSSYRSSSSGASHSGGSFRSSGSGASHGGGSFRSGGGSASHGGGFSHGGGRR